MPTLTVELTEEAYQNALALPVAERERLIVNMFTTARNEPPSDEGDGYDELPDPELTAEDLASIGRGIADYEAGRVIPAEEVFARARERYGWTK